MAIGAYARIYNMEQDYQPRRRNYSASFFKSRAVLFGAALLLASQLFHFFQLLEEAGMRAEAGQAPPEDYTVTGIVARVVRIALLVASCILLSRHQSGKSRMRRNRLYLLVGALLVLWAGISFVTTLLDIFVYPEFILILDCLTIAACMIAPIVILLVHDFNGLPPDDTILLFLGIGGIGFSIISLVIIGVVLRASYTFWRLVPELLLRVGQGFFGIATLQKALRIRKSYPLVTTAEPERKPPVKKPAPRPKQEEGFTLHLEEDVRYTTSRTPMPNAPQYGDPQYTGQTPRPDASQYGNQQYTGRTPVPNAPQYGNPQYTSRTPRPESVAGQNGANQYTGRVPRPEPVQGRNPRSGGQSPPETPRLEREPDAWHTGRIIIQGGTGRIPTKDPGTVPSQRQTCPYCGKRMPLGFPNCPRCGRNM